MLGHSVSLPVKIRYKISWLVIHLVSVVVVVLLNKQDNKSSEKLLHVYFLNSIPIMMLLWLTSPLSNSTWCRKMY